MTTAQTQQWARWKHRWGPGAVAGAVSVAIHVVALVLLCFFEFGRSSAEAASLTSPSAAVQRISQLARQVRVLPKPKVQRPPVTAGPGAEPATVERVFDSLRALPTFEPNLPAATTVLPFEWPDRVRIAEHVEFFGSKAARRRVCYIVECSPAMQGSLEQVRRELIGSIEALQPDQYFGVIFFGGGRLWEFGGDRLLRATPRAVAAAAAFIKAVETSGSADPAAAFERAVQIGGRQQAGGLVIYFLTRGFEAAGIDAVRASQHIYSLLDGFAPGVQVNTIGLAVQGMDRRVLEQIAEATGGVFVSPGRAAGETDDTMDIVGHSFFDGMGNSHE
ncbi:MAG TPA: VWA domain-containing protein [Phycisphaerales bacterium]|nr:VWA domain-containing protein [Phycisphaerales bacterium]